MKIFLGAILVVLITSNYMYCQNQDLQLGGDANKLRQNQGALYDYSDPEAVNIKVSVWGFVKYPGRYIIPNYNTVLDLFSLAGGPIPDANLDDLRIFRTNSDSTKTFIKFNYKDFLWEDTLTTYSKAPALQAGDVLLVPGSQRLYFKDYMTLSLSIFSALVSLAILIINISK